MALVYQSNGGDCSAANAPIPELDASVGRIHRYANVASVP